MNGWMDCHITLLFFSSDFFVGFFLFGHSVLVLLPFFFVWTNSAFTAPPGTFSKVSMFPRGGIKSTNQPRLLGPVSFGKGVQKENKKKKIGF